MRKILNMILAIFLLYSCEHKDLCYDHSHVMEVNVIFDWSKISGASPKSMSIYLFPTNGKETVRYEFPRHSGGKIRVTPGSYKAICLNSDTESVRVSESGNYENFNIYTKDTEILSSLSGVGVRSQGAPRADGTEWERVALSTDPIWTSCLSELVLDSPNDVIEMQMEKDFTTFDITVRNVKHINYVYAVSASITSLSEAYYPGIKKLSENNITVPFGMRTSIDENIFYGQFISFGHCPAGSGSVRHHYMTIYVIMQDGSKNYYTYDVTEQIHSAADPNNIIIDLDGLDLPEPDLGGGGGGGFKPDVNDWNDIDIDINM